jgi:hypothetical protein
MAHLGADVAAYVDGQLPGDAATRARAHVEQCQQCADAVEQQRRLKMRVSAAPAPEPPSDLIASLSSLAQSGPVEVSRRRRSVSMRTPLAIVAAFAVVLMAAYSMGGTRPRVADPVSPQFDEMVAEFAGRTPAQSTEALTDQAMYSLHGSGWPCHKDLGGYQRVRGDLSADGSTLILRYRKDDEVLTLTEQVGALGPDALEGFSRVQVGRWHVWVKESGPTVVTWDAAGTVFTIVTQGPAQGLGAVLDALPHDVQQTGPLQRVGDGLDRMASWAGL